MSFTSLSSIAAGSALGDGQAAKRQRMANPSAPPFGQGMEILSTEDYEEIFSAYDGGFTMATEDESGLASATLSVFPIPRMDMDNYRDWNFEGTTMMLVMQGFPAEDDVSPRLRFQEGVETNGFMNLVSLTTINRHLEALHKKGKPDTFLRYVASHVRPYGVVAATTQDHSREKSEWSQDNPMAVTVLGEVNIHSMLRYFDDLEIKDVNMRDAASVSKGDISVLKVDTDKDGRIRKGDHMFVYYDDKDHAFYPGFSHTPITSETLNRKTLEPKMQLFWKLGRVLNYPDMSIRYPYKTLKTQEVRKMGSTGRYVQIAMTCF